MYEKVVEIFSGKKNEIGRQDKIREILDNKDGMRLDEKLLEILGIFKRLSKYIRLVWVLFEC